MIRRISVFAIIAMLAIVGSASAFTISGTIIGGQSGITLKAVVGIPTNLDTILLTAALPILNTYALTNAQPGGYMLFAYQDLNVNLRPDLDEPRGFYGGTYPEIMTIAGDTSGVNIELRPPNNGGFTGTVTYEGAQRGATIIAAYDNPSMSGTPRGAGAVLDTTGAGNFIAFVDTFGTYYAYAFMDLNLNFSYDLNEPFGFYGITAPQSFTVQQTNFPDNINITLHDPSASPNPVSALPKSPLLISAYPNPFNSVARLGFSIPIDSDAEVSVFDISGRLVRTLLSGPVAAGEHFLTFESGNLPSGFYLISLRNQARSTTAKVLLLK
ncbi:T9SS C-terminal target domain-containing protein [candidate division KSB1 bacterium]|nr:MAG: T9SS C-terminal target domain-containing protein [candidate division KSB1 bacterium]